MELERVPVLEEDANEKADDTDNFDLMRHDRLSGLSTGHGIHQTNDNLRIKSIQHLTQLYSQSLSWCLPTHLRTLHLVSFHSYGINQPSFIEQNTGL